MGFILDILSTVSSWFDLRDLLSRRGRGPGSPTPSGRRGSCSAGRPRHEAGMTTAEYAIGTIAACTFAALLIAIVRSPEIREALLSIITSALDLGR